MLRKIKNLKVLKIIHKNYTIWLSIIESENLSTTKVYVIFSFLYSLSFYIHMKFMYSNRMNILTNPSPLYWSVNQN